MTNGANILIVDDRPENLYALQKVLKEEPYSITTALSGKEALKKVLKQNFDLILLDVQMSGMDGFEVAEILHSNNVTQEVPIIFITAISKDKKYVIKGLEVGAIDYLSKPIDSNILKLKISTYIKFFQQKNELDRAKIKLEEVNNEVKLTNEKLLKNNDDLNTALKKLKSTQEQLIQSEKMASLGIMTAGIAHEINNPINFINGGIFSLNKCLNDFMKVVKMYDQFLDSKELEKKALAIKELKEEVDYNYLVGHIPELTQDIQTGINRTREIVNGLLNFSRLDKGTFIPEDIHKLIDSTLLILKNRYKNTIEINKNYDSKTPLIQCYPSQLSLAFMNIISNAIDTINGEGEIKITTKVLKNKIRVLIEDSGSGIQPEHLNKIFDPFFTTKDVGKGTGLGLSISYGVISKHHGSINVKSKLGVGSEFIIELPTTHVSKN